MTGLFNASQVKYPVLGTPLAWVYPGTGFSRISVLRRGANKKHIISLCGIALDFTVFHSIGEGYWKSTVTCFSKYRHHCLVRFLIAGPRRLPALGDRPQERRRQRRRDAHFPAHGPWRSYRGRRESLPLPKLVMAICIMFRGGLYFMYWNCRVTRSFTSIQGLSTAANCSSLIILAEVLRLVKGWP